MKKFLFVLAAVAALGCSGDDDGGGGCGSHNGRALHRGPEGGCYYYNSSNNQVYVDRSECKC